jgi:DNA ligase 1
LTLSPKYRAAEGLADASEKGVSLRFPRLVRIRDDKTPEQATNSRQVAELYRKQESVAQGKKGGVDDDFEY